MNSQKLSNILVSPLHCHHHYFLKYNSHNQSFKPKTSGTMYNTITTTFNGSQDHPFNCFPRGLMCMYIYIHVYIFLCYLCKCVVCIVKKLCHSRGLRQLMGMASMLELQTSRKNVKV